MSAATLEQALARGRSNNFDLIRLVAAAAVVVSHAWPLSLGPGTKEPLENLVHTSLGGVAVMVFFFASGLLVRQSADRNMIRFVRFVRARAFRIMPGLAVALIVTILIVVATGAPFVPSAALDYFLRGLTLVSIRHELPGAFHSNPYAGAVNGPLWTLFYEVACYILMSMAVWSGLLGRMWGRALAAAALAALWIATYGPDGLPTALGYRLTKLAPLAVAFGLGVIAWEIRAHLQLRWAAGAILVALAALAQDTILYTPLFAAALGYGILLLAYNVPPRPLSLDISYGIYIYGWPVAQSVVALTGTMSPAMLAVTSLAATVPIALASWYLVEKPALSRVASRRSPAHSAN